MAYFLSYYNVISFNDRLTVACIIYNKNFLVNALQVRRDIIVVNIVWHNFDVINIYCPPSGILREITSEMEFYINKLIHKNIVIISTFNVKSCLRG